MNNQTPIPTPEQMAKLLANFVLQHRSALNTVLGKYGLNISGYSALDALSTTERLIQNQEGFANDLLLAMKERYEAMQNFIQNNNRNFRNFSLAEIIAGGISGVMTGVSSLITATSDSTKKVNETMAQAELLKAQALLQGQQSAAMIEAGRQKATIKIVAIIVGSLAAAGVVTGLVIFFVKRHKKGKAAKAA